MTNKTKLQKIKNFLTTYVPPFSAVRGSKEVGGWLKDKITGRTDIHISELQLENLKKKLKRKKLEKEMGEEGYSKYQTAERRRKQNS